ncbi:TPA: class Ib ribonucleoside-diphosphate reductase assembly flavoprotein NrdI [Streptococcus suis]
MKTHLLYFSVTSNTKRFVAKTGLPSIEITESNYNFEMEDPFFLLIPTFVPPPDVVEDVYEFLEIGNNLSQCKGFIGSGNRNFGDHLFCITAREMSETFGVPVIYEYELAGTWADVERVRKLAEEVSSNSEG